MTAYRKYFEPASVALKKLLTAGKLGALRTIHTAFTNNLPPSANSWHLDETLAGGGVADGSGYLLHQHSPLAHWTGTAGSHRPHVDHCPQSLHEQSKKTSRSS